MKKILILSILIILGLMSSGCATWDGVKKDSSGAWNSSKKAVHDATE
ncbi:MAG: entericidin EcnAB [Campylobacterota bacterium]|nr:entericidin EcnAB [Campylobacterota bacterium]